jgi:hypothetical protein
MVCLSTGIAIVTVPLGVATGATVGVGVGLGVGSGFSITNKGDEVRGAAATVNFGEAMTARVPATRTRSVNRKTMTVLTYFSSTGT